jgi:hypothetical protein
MDWIDLAQDRDEWQALANTITILQVPYNGRNFLTSSEPVSFSRTLLHEVSNGQQGSKPMGWCCWVMDRAVKQEANRR